MVIVVRFKWSILFIVLVGVVAVFFMFQNKYRQLGIADPIFDKSLNLYFSVQNAFGFSSVCIWTHNLTSSRRVSWHVGKVIDLLIEPVSKHDVYCLLLRGDDEYIKKVSFFGENTQDVRSFLDSAVCMSDVLPDNKLLISYAPWVDTHSFFVGRTSGDWKLASLNLDTGKIQDFLQKNSVINSPKSIRGTDSILFRYSDAFKDDPREFKTYNLKTK